MTAVVHPAFSEEADRPRTDRIDYRDLLYPRVSRMLYNPGDEPVEFSVGGETMALPPRDQYAPKKAWGLREDQSYEGSRALPGVLPMRDRYLNKLVQGTQGNVIYTVMPAAEQVTMTCVLGPDGTTGSLARRGVRLLSDDPAVNEIIMADARAAWEEAIAIADITIIRGHEQINRKRQETSTPLVPPNERVRRAYERRTRREASGKLARLYECPTCGIQNQSEMDRNNHIVATHPEAARAMGVGQTTSFDIEGNTRLTNAADVYGRGVTGAVGGHREVVMSPDGQVVSERWVGETPLEAEARMNRAALAHNAPLREQAAMDANGEIVSQMLKQQAELQARLEQMEEMLAQRAAQEHAESQTVSGEAERKTALDAKPKGTKVARAKLAEPIKKGE